MSDLDLLEKPSVAARISLAFGASATAAFVSGLVVEVARELTRATAAAEAARADALSPQLTSSAIRNARELASDMEFERDRLQVAAAKLRDRLAELKASEENTKRKIAYDKAQAERDAVAEELKSYPAIAEKLVQLLSRLVDCNSEVAAINSRLPTGAPRLEPAEYCAKGAQPLLAGGVNLDVSLLECRVQPWHPRSNVRWPR